MLDVAFSKHVVLNNYRLRVCYNIAMLGTVGLIILLMLVQKQWASEVTFVNEIRTAAWISEGPVTRAIQQLYSSKVNSSVCKESQIYDFQSGLEPSWLYTNFSCIPLCARHYVARECLHLGDVIHQNGRDEVFFATSVHSTFLAYNATPTSQKMYFTPWEDAYTLQFMYSYNVPQWSLASFRNLNMAQSFLGSSSKDTLTVLLDAHGKPSRTYSPSAEGIPLRVRELMDLAGQPNWLDTPQYHLGKNQIPGSVYENGPAARVSGLEIMIVVKCFNSINVPPGLDLGGWTGSVCTAQVEASSQSWVTRTTRDNILGQPREVTQSGVLIKFRAEGAVRNLDLGNLFDFLIHAVVILWLSHLFFKKFACKALGGLSSVYKSAVNEQFHISEYLSQIKKNWKQPSGKQQHPNVCEEHDRNEGCLYKDEFMTANVFPEELAFQKATKLLDVDRKVGPIESFFLPSYIKKERVDSVHDKEPQPLSASAPLPDPVMSAGRTLAVDKPDLAKDGARQPDNTDASALTLRQGLQEKSMDKFENLFSRLKALEDSVEVRFQRQKQELELRMDKLTLKPAWPQQHATSENASRSCSRASGRNQAHSSEDGSHIAHLSTCMSLYQTELSEQQYWVQELRNKDMKREEEMKEFRFIVEGLASRFRQLLISMPEPEKCNHSYRNICSLPLPLAGQTDATVTASGRSVRTRGRNSTSKVCHEDSVQVEHPSLLLDAPHQRVGVNLQIPELHPPSEPLGDNSTPSVSPRSLSGIRDHVEPMGITLPVLDDLFHPTRPPLDPDSELVREGCMDFDQPELYEMKPTGETAFEI